MPWKHYRGTVLGGVQIAISLAVAGCGGSEEFRTPEERMVIDSAPVCVSCEIAFEQIGFIPEVERSIRPFASAAGDSGRLFITHNDGTLASYDSTGRFEFAIGRRGGGPGEYEAIRNVISGADGRIHILDAQLARHSVFGSDGRFLWSTPLPAAASGRAKPAALLSGGRLVIGVEPGVADGKDGQASLFQIADSSGNIVSSFWPMEATDRQPWRHSRMLLLVRSDGEIIAGEPYHFSLRRWTLDGVEQPPVARVAKWLPAIDTLAEPSDGVNERPYTESMFSMWEDRSGLVWLHFTIPDPEWRSGPSEALNRKLRPDEYRALVNRPRVVSVLEVIDLMKNEVVAHKRVRGSLGDQIGNGTFLKTLIDSSGVPGIGVFQAQLLIDKGKPSNARRD